MVRIVTESTADIPVDMAMSLGITVVPSYVVFGSETYREGTELTREQFYEKLVTLAVIPTTATPPPEVYEKVYRKLAEKTDEIVSVHLAAGLSGLHNAAAVAAGRITGARIAVLDSEQISMGYGWMAVAAAEAAQRGDTMESIIALIDGMKRRSKVIAVLDTLDYLHRGGRVGWVPAVVGTLLRIKPLIEIWMGRVRLVERVRTQRRALEQLLQRIRALGPMERAIVLHTNAPAQAEVLASKLQTMHTSWEQLIGHAGVTIASHAGPGAVGVACVTAN